MQKRGWTFCCGIRVPAFHERPHNGGGALGIEPANMQSVNQPLIFAQPWARFLFDLATYLGLKILKGQHEQD
jgi:hypothetical protein